VVARNEVQRTIWAIFTNPADGTPSPRSIGRGNVISNGPPNISIGLFVQDGSTYSGNRVNGQRFGVLVFGHGPGTTFERNDFRGNLWDCYDDSAIPATWIDNLGDTSRPPGICSPAP
jgi:hypothetical protein